MRAAALLGLLALLLLALPPATEATTTAPCCTDPAPASLEDVRVAAVAAESATVRWAVAGCAATTWAAYRDAAAADSSAPFGERGGWARTPAQDGMGAFEADLTGLAAGRRYVAYVDGSGGDCGGPWGLAPSADLCFQTPPLEPSCGDASPTTAPTTGVVPGQRPDGYDAAVTGITADAATVTWTGAACRASRLDGFVLRPGTDGTTPIASPELQGPGPHTHRLDGLPAGASVQFSILGCGDATTAYCFQTAPLPKECTYTGHTIAPRWGLAASRARPALAIGLAFGFLALLALGAARRRLA